MNKESKKEETSTDSSVIKNTQISIENTLLAIITALVVMSAVQVFQLQGIASAISNGSIKATTQIPSGSSVGLPSQVGGCG